MPCTQSLFSGKYAGFDENEPTSRSGGKGVVIQFLKENKGYKNLLLIGDGVTDLEAYPPADGFIGTSFINILEIYVYTQITVSAAFLKYL